jgi:hypothetical protein
MCLSARHTTVYASRHTTRHVSENMVTQRAIEVRLRRAAERRGLRIEKSKLRDPGAIGFGTWRIIDARTGRVVAADRRNGYGLTLEDVARRLGKTL